MSGQQLFGPGGAPANTASWNAVGVHESVPVPTGRAMANGDTRILVDGIVMYAGGNGGTRTTTCYVGGASVALSTPAASGGQAIGGTTTARALVTPGSVEAGMFFSGGTYFGWTAFSGRTIVEKDGSPNRTNASLNGYYDWLEAPTVPRSPAGNADSGTQVTITWVAPLDDGGASITGYRLEYSTDPTFATGVTGINLGVVLTRTITGLTPGTTYYFRIAARNEVTTLAGTYGVFTATGNVTTDNVPGTPSAFTATPSGTTAVDLSWVAPANNGSAIIEYEVDRSASPSFTGVTTVTVTGTSTTIGSLTPGNTYYFRVRARNAVGYGAYSSTQSVTLGSAPGAPTGLTATPSAGALALAWAAPASTGGQPITSYRIEYTTDPTFATGVVTVDTGTTVTSRSIVGLTPGTTYYARVKATNSIGTGAASGSANGAIPARTVLDLVKSASVSVDGLLISIRSDGANNPTLTLGYTAFGTGTTFTTIATVTGFSLPGQLRNIALVADPDGNLYVIGASASSTVRVLRYARTGPTSWAAPTVLTAALTATGESLVQFAAAYVPGSGVSPIPTILVLARRSGTLGAGALSWATLNLANLAAGTGALFRASGSDPSWLSTPPTGATPNGGLLDIVPLVDGGTRLAILANGFAVVDVANATVSSVAKSANGTALTGAWGRVLGIDAGTFALLVAGSPLTIYVYTATGTLLGSDTLANGLFQGGTPGTQWDAYFDTVADVITIYYIADNAGARQLESVDFAPSTLAQLAPTVLTATLGSASSTNSIVRVPGGAYVDERRVLVEAANILSGTKSTVPYSDRSGNAAPSSPSLVDEAGFDASAARVFAWAFGDSNPLDLSTAYELDIERVSDGVAVVSTGKVASAAQSRSVAGGSLVNGIDYRWRVRTWDELDTLGAWSAYDTFTTSALGTLDITTPAADNPPGLEVADIDIEWTYTQANGYTQTQRRVRLIRVSDSAVLSDTTMQASTANTYTVPSVPTDEPVRIEVSIVTNAPGTPTVGPALRLLTTSYGAPMPPELALTVGESYVEVAVTNPEPTGDRPEVVRNDIERRAAGDESFVRIASIGYNDSYLDHAVASGKVYEYRVKGVSA